MARVEAAAQKLQNKPVRKPVQNVGSVRSRPLAGKSFFLDLPGGKTLEFLEKSVKRFGGVVESFLSKEVMCIVSSNQEARKESWGRKQIAAVLRSAQAGTQTSVGLGKGHQGPLDKPADVVLVTRGKALLQRAIRTQSNSCSSNGVLASARSWGIQIMHMDDMFSYLQWLDSRKGRSTRQMKPFPSGPQSALKVMRLQPPFLKVEDESRNLRPFLQQFKNFPELRFPERRRHSPFDPPRSPASSKAPEGQPAPSGASSDGCLVPKRQRGYCECCEETFVELQTHLQSLRHTAFVRDASHYAPVDSLISQMANVFAVSSGSLQPLRVPPATSGDHSGFHEDVLQGIAAPSGQPPESCLPGESSGGWPLHLGSSADLPEDQSLWQWEELLGDTLGLPAPVLTSPSRLSPSGQAGGGSSAAEDRGKGGTSVDAPLKPSASPEAGSWPVSQHQIRTPPPALLPSQPRKRKLSSSPRGQVKKRPALTGLPRSQLLPDPNALLGTLPVGTTEGSFSQERDSQTGPGCLRLPAVPVAQPGLRTTPGGSTWPPREQVVTDPGGLKQLVLQLEQKHGSAVRPSEEWPTQTPCTLPGVDAKLSTPDFPAGPGMSSQPPGFVAQPCPPVTEAEVVSEGSGLGLPPLSCSREPSSSESEWDGPLLCALEGASRFPFERPVDSALLGACVSMRDSGYDSHLCSVLWQTLEPHEARLEGDSDGCRSHRDVLWTPLSSLGTCLDIS